MDKYYNAIQRRKAINAMPTEKWFEIAEGNMNFIICDEAKQLFIEHGLQNTDLKVFLLQGYLHGRDFNKNNFVDQKGIVVFPKAKTPNVYVKYSSMSYENFIDEYELFRSVKVSEDDKMNFQYLGFSRRFFFEYYEDENSDFYRKKIETLFQQIE